MECGTDIRVCDIIPHEVNFELALAGSKVSNPEDMGRTVSNASGYAPEDDMFDPRADDFVSKERNYIHFDLPLSEIQRTGISFTPAQILKHSFWPLLGFTSIERRAKKDRKTDKLVFEDKERPIKFGSHCDAALLEWYTHALSRKYETYLEDKEFSTSVLAYRSGLGDNIDQAKSLFDEIRVRKNCIAVAVDIKGFFDHVNHDNLKECLIDVTCQSPLDNADYRIFERMTKFEWVDSDLLSARLGRMYGKRGRICSSKQFREIVRGLKPSLINVNPAGHGIPQGTPLSGLYANISMARFDCAVSDRLKDIGASYRRYSDDIAVLVSNEHTEDEVMTIINEELQRIGLWLSEKKTEICEFTSTNGTLSSTKPFQYLGFTFDGQHTRIRQSSLNKYYSKMHLGIKSKIRAAKDQNIERDNIFLRELFKRYTHFGRNRNFPRYAYRAARKLNAPEIKKQLRRHMFVFKKALRYYLDRAYR
jgi:RNA-directed DNA polymerase